MLDPECEQSNTVVLTVVCCTINSTNSSQPSGETACSVGDTGSQKVLLVAWFSVIGVDHATGELRLHAYLVASPL